MIIDPYVDPGTGVSFTALPGAFGDEVVGLVKNKATRACVEPAGDDQKLGTGRESVDDTSIGFGGDAIIAAFPKEIPGPVTVSVEYQTASGEPIRLRLFDAAGAEVAAITADAVPPDGTCGFPGGPRARTTLSLTSDKPVASAIMDVPSGCCVFVIDDFTSLPMGSPRA